VKVRSGEEEREVTSKQTMDKVKRSKVSLGGAKVKVLGGCPDQSMEGVVLELGWSADTDALVVGDLIVSLSRNQKT
jgi:hypothetical protein